MPRIVSAYPRPDRLLLVTGFEPFGGETVNPAWEAVSRLPEIVGPYCIARLRVPVVFGEAGDLVTRAMDSFHADDVLCVGQAGGRDALMPELVAVNRRRGRTPDNAGNAPDGEPCVPDGPSAYFSTLPVQAMAEASAAAGVRARVSYGAGLYVCNDLMYRVLHETRRAPVRAGFVHVPFLPEQAKNGAPSMPLEEIVRGLTAMIGAL